MMISEKNRFTRTVEDDAPALNKKRLNREEEAAEEMLESRRHWKYVECRKRVARGLNVVVAIGATFSYQMYAGD